ncbi:MAG TPA: phosphoadenylyl-sulfate reductase [Thermoleophilia bacterium]|nr:phosphoadenylyl-sulfate reductase [Thermoleophilia bacterium]
MTQQETVAEILAELADASAEDVLAAAARRFPGRVAFASSLGTEDQVVTALIAEAKLDIPIFTLDTGRLYPDTYDLIARTKERYGVTIHVYFPAADEVEEMVNRDGVNCFRESIEARKRCCEIRKVRPLRRAQIGLDAWICGLRSGQGATRQTVEMAEWDAAAALVKINPLAAWDEADVWSYVRAHDVPYNQLHDAGFPSIGCAPCTRAVPEGEDARSGRWWWESAEHRECGLHHRSAPTGAAS